MRVSTDIIGRRSETVNEIKVGRGGRRGEEGEGRTKIKWRDENK